MAVILRPRQLTPEQRAFVVDAVLNGTGGDYPEYEDVFLEVAEALPGLLARSGIPDNSDNRRRITELLVAYLGTPRGKAPPRAASYRRFAR